MLSLIVAYDDERGIGKANGLLWRIPPDHQNFKRLTTGHPIIMGRKTYESIGRPLPERTNIVVSRQAGFSAPSCVVVDSLPRAYATAEAAAGSEEVFVIGGGQIYEQSLPQVDRLYITKVEGTHGADTFFPSAPVEFTESSREVRESDGYRYAFVTLDKPVSLR